MNKHIEKSNTLLSYMKNKSMKCELLSCTFLESSAMHRNFNRFSKDKTKETKRMIKKIKSKTSTNNTIDK